MNTTTPNSVILDGYAQSNKPIIEGKASVIDCPPPEFIFDTFGRKFKINKNIEVFGRHGTDIYHTYDGIIGKLCVFVLAQCGTRDITWDDSDDGINGYTGNNCHGGDHVYTCYAYIEEN